MQENNKYIDLGALSAPYFFAQKTELWYNKAKALDRRESLEQAI